MTDFEKILEFSLKWEGGDTITDDPDDPGGLTKYGISQRAHPSVDIRNLTYEQAKEIYRLNYWEAGKCGLLPHLINMVHFDCCVNTGLKRAAIILQKSCDVTADGIIGPETMRNVVDKNQRLLAEKMIVERDVFYENLAKNNPVMGKYLIGWQNRTRDLLNLVRSQNETLEIG